MLISVVVPVYNVQDYLKGCLDSILRNDLADCEIILVDDGATDRSGEICDSYAAEHPGLIRVIHQENGGLGAARNTGMREAKGDWLLFVDSDDKIVPETVSVLKKRVSEQVDIIAFQFLHDDGENPPEPRESGAAATEKPFALTERKSELLALPSAWMRLWRRSLFLNNGIEYPSRVWYEDIRTTAKLLPLARGIIVLPDHLYAYLERPGSIMNNAKLARNQEILEAMDDILSWYREQGLYSAYSAELEALTVQHVLLAASVRVARADPKHPLLQTFREYTDRNFPNWIANPYLKELPRGKALALRLIRGRHFRLVSLLFKLKG